MVTCKKCGSKLPDTYKYCIFCSQRLPATEKNGDTERFSAPPLFNICMAAAGVLIAVAIIAACIILFL